MSLEKEIDRMTLIERKQRQILEQMGIKSLEMNSEGDIFIDENNKDHYDLYFDDLKEK